MHKFFKKHEYLEKVEHYNAKLIPVAIVALLFIIIYELFLHVENHTLELIVKILDLFVIAVFMIDIIFLAARSKNAKFFFKNYWLDLLAIFPFALIFNLIGQFYKAVVLVTERFVVGQAIAHETIEARKSIRALARSGKITRGIRIAARSIRIAAKSRLFKHFRAEHHLKKRGLKHDRMKVKPGQKKTSKKKSSR